MTARLIDGKAIAQALREDIRKKVAELVAAGTLTAGSLGEGCRVGSVGAQMPVVTVSSLPDL